MGVAPPQICALCGAGPAQTEHHLVPKVKGGKAKVRICNECHRQIHALFSHHALKYEFNTVEKLQGEERMASFIAWRKKHPNTVFRVRQSRRKL